MKNNKPLAILGIILALVLVINFVSAHCWAFDNSPVSIQGKITLPYNISANATYNIVTQDYTIIAKFTKIMGGTNPSLYRVMWCNGSAIDCCSGGYNPITLKCNTGINAETCNFQNGDNSIATCSLFQDCIFGGDPNANWVVNSSPSSSNLIETKTFTVKNLTNFVVAGGYSFAPLGSNNNNGQRAYPIAVSAVLTNPQDLVPSNVSNLNSYNITNHSINWNWTNPTLNFVGTRVYLNGNSVANFSSSINSYQNNSLLPNTTYNLTVYSVGLTGAISSGVSNVSKTLTSSNYSNQTNSSDFPVNVTNLRVINTTNETITINWTNPLVNFNGTIVGIPGYNYSVPAGAHNYTLVDLLPNTTYNITVYSVGLNGLISNGTSVLGRTNATTINTTPNNFCSDGTLFGACSSSKPKYCNLTGSLVDNASYCGCPSGLIVSGNSCILDNNDDNNDNNHRSRDCANSSDFISIPSSITHDSFVGSFNASNNSIGLVQTKVGSNNNGFIYWLAFILFLLIILLLVLIYSLRN